MGDFIRLSSKPRARSENLLRPDDGEDEEDQTEEEKQSEKELRNPCRGDSQAGETEERRDQRDHEEDNGPFNHAPISHLAPSLRGPIIAARVRAIDPDRGR